MDGARIARDDGCGQGNHLQCYAAAPAHSYWDGCSAGGRQGLKEAQRFPADFDGIVAGSPGLDWTGRAAQAVRVAQRLQPNEAARLSPAKTRLVHTAALDACDALDGVTDGVIDDPRSGACSIPASCKCGAPDTMASCLTAPQVSTARMLYARRSTRRRSARSALYPGSELGWTDLGGRRRRERPGSTSSASSCSRIRSGQSTHSTSTPNRARGRHRQRHHQRADPNLAPFIARGGKLISITAGATRRSRREQRAVLPARVAALSETRPGSGVLSPVHGAGMGHCRGGDGPNSFDISARSNSGWKRAARARPHPRLACHERRVDRTRPLCPYRQWRGTTEQAARTMRRTSRAGQRSSWRSSRRSSRRSGRPAMCLSAQLREPAPRGADIQESARESAAVSA